MSPTSLMTTVKDTTQDLDTRRFVRTWYGVKHDGKHRACLVAGGHLTDTHRKWWVLALYAYTHEFPHNKAYNVPKRLCMINRAFDQYTPQGSLLPSILAITSPCLGSYSVVTKKCNNSASRSTPPQGIRSTSQETVGPIASFH